MSLRGSLASVLSARHLRWAELDWHILVFALALLGIGMTFVYGLSNPLGEHLGDEALFLAHLQKVALTLPLVFVCLFVRSSWLRRNALWIYGACLALLVAVYFVGEERNNAQRWIQLPKFDLQPSELAKIGMILALASVLAGNRLRSPGNWVRPLVVGLVPLALVAGQPDLGTAMTLVPVLLGMLYLAGARGRSLLGLGLLGLLVGVVAVRGELVHDYQKERIETWLDTYAPEPLIEGKDGAAFHLYHARVVAGNGGKLGRGLGRGVANETGLLPERASDSIFMVVAEEAGFIGATGVLLLYALMAGLMMLRASGLRDRFARLVVGGVALYFAGHLLINVSVNVGLLPMTGLTLPLFSTGGSSLLASFIALGLALGQAANHERTLDRDAFRSY